MQEPEQLRNRELMPAPGLATAASPTLLAKLRGDWLLWTLVLVLAGLSVQAPKRMATYATLVDWPTIATLAGLLILTKGIETSGYLDRLGRRLVRHFADVRTLALALVAASAFLAMWLTNDVALFIVVPLTLRLAGNHALPIVRLVVFEALAVNAGSTLTPIGNPQNLYLWRVSGQTFYRFVGAMLPIAAIMFGALMLLTYLSFRPRPLESRPDVPATPIDGWRLWLAALLYIPFLIAADRQEPFVGVAVVLVLYLLAQRQVLAKVDWPLLAVFVLMFVDLRLIGASETVRTLVERAGLAQPTHLFLTAVAASQFISNVPTTILLHEFSKNWQLIAYGANVGGFGLAIGSLANLIALRQVTNSRAWLVFHAFSVPFLVLITGLCYAWTFTLMP